MNKLSEWKLAQKITASGRKGFIIGLAIAAVICLIVALLIIKMHWLKKHFGCLKCDVDELSDDFAEGGNCCYGTEKDFV